jgi:hypothetical protein
MPGEMRGLCCKICKSDEMVYVINKRCPCGKRSTYNIPGKRPICCSECKTEEMINIVSKKCPCGHRPNFNVPEDKRPICCSKCKTDDMVNVVNKKCPCGKQPVFNIPGEIIGICCKECKTDDMINVKIKRCLCGNNPIYNIPDETIGICCKECKTNNMICVVGKICPGYEKTCPVRTYLSNGHKYCMSCDPNEDRRKLYKRYEEAFFDYINDKLNIYKREFRVSLDQTETSKKFARLDGIVFGDDIIVCLEVDENGHEDYDCDEHRMHLVTGELLQTYSNHVVSWVRVNPTTDEKSQSSKKSKAIREKRFDDVINAVNDILEKRETRVVYIGFE